ncbi:translation initiation factor IF-2 [Calothrix sp. UHCC 0171]|uniref:translation initiation factor IF-2 n=1 Tax=Calothrix sp. UHCC 0171 TaxID=3110245 RepID=UPI002B1E9D37|nr:translation initiation factor IF-2 [Calothrix sp. UHCC 0171]MEA5571284.1 translation initiation factor IF-2 [Calothrix sp. UHCC 0171]
MTNGKVRIYELSKELNLDNKELLAICDQLSIAVKSHSSTISEPDAQRIRSEAEKLAVTNAHSRKDQTTSQKHSLQNTGQYSGSRDRPAASNKQEILEIRKPKLLNNSSTNAVEASSTTNNQFAHSESNPSSPRPFAPVSPMKPTAPIRPVPRNPSETTQQTAPADVENKDNKPTSNQPAEKVAAEKTEKSSTAPRAKAEKPQKPQLVAPPPRPAAEATVAAQTPAATQAVTNPAVPAEKPILKRDRSAPPQENRNEQQAPGKPRVNKGGEGQPSGTPRPARSGAPGGQERRAGRQSPPPGGGDVQRPSRPSRSPEVGIPTATPPRLIAAPTRPTADASATNEAGGATTSVVELKRPLPPRLGGKGGKKWQEEEIDEGKESKAAKLTKNKRVKPIIEEDFEEDDLLDDEDGDANDVVQVSNAIIRPPKPKSSRPSQPAAVTIASPQKGRRPSQQREQNRGNRRETEVKRERPEILIVTGPMTVQELADALAIADTEIVKILFMKAIPVSITQNLDIPTITLVATELEVLVETQEPEAEARKVTEMIEVGDLDKLHRRPPVVTIMGHVDHGKTTLLDSIRKTKVAAGEAGGITQHIGAYHVDVEHNGEMQQVVFLDTPGHEAFTAMRARGARVTDIAILVVAADDGVRPQTIEAISHAQAAEVPIIVAINKIDKEGAQPDRVKQELTQYGMTAEEWGGDTIMVPVSAIKGENLDTLLEMILLVAEVGELSANPNRPAKGTVIEAHLDKAKGAVATLLIQNGTLRVGDILVAGCVFGKVRAMVDDRGQRVEAASPSFAVEVLGLSDVPAAGDEFEAFLVEKEARSVAATRAEKIRQSRLMQGRVTLAGISAKAQEGELKELNLILKGDVQGSVEAIVGSLKQLPQNEVQIRLLLSSAGEITQTDIDLAAASGAVIIGFNTTYASGARAAADEAGVDVREYNIIYKLLEDIQDALEGLLEPELVEEPLGQAEVRAVFPVGRGAVAGCYVQNGKLVRNCKIRVARGGKVIYEGVLDSLKRMKEDAREVKDGYECGIGLDKFNDWVEGDIIEAFQMVTKRRTLSMTK